MLEFGAIVVRLFVEGLIRGRFVRERRPNHKKHQNQKILRRYLQDYFQQFPVRESLLGYCWLGSPNPNLSCWIWQSSEAISGIAGNPSTGGHKFALFSH
jgi:hypothetical protein